MSRFSSPRIEPKGIDALDEFKALRRWADRDTRHSSRNKDYIEHPAFAQIVSMGAMGLSFLLNERLSWGEMSLLCAFLGGRPEIPEEARGRLGMMQKIYRDWVRTLGHEYTGPDAT